MRSIGSACRCLAETLDGCKAADAVLLGAIGGPKWDSVALDKRPEAGLLKIRKELGLYINLRPVRPRPALRGISPLKRTASMSAIWKLSVSWRATFISAPTKSRAKASTPKRTM